MLYVPLPFLQCVGQLIGPPQQHKRRTFFITVYGVTPDEEYMILKVTQETTAQEVLQQVRTHHSMMPETLSN